MLEFAWVILPIIVPLLGGIVCFLLPARCRWLGLLWAIATLICVAGLGWQLSQLEEVRYPIGGWGAPLGIDLFADGLSLMMLMTTALTGLGISVYACGYFGADKAGHFWPLWLLLWGALNALFLSADIFNLYVTLELLGLAAVALVALAGGAQALTSAMRYLLVGLLSSLFYLLGVALLYHGVGTLDLALLAERIVPSPSAWVALGLMGAGLLIKSALFPLHFWLPPAHANAPTPVSALLSALVVKAAFYILLRLWWALLPATTVPLAQLLGALGGIAVVWGGLLALRQTRLKLLIAYSTVSQLGYLFLVFPLGIGLAWKGAVYMVLSHAMAKAALFMAAGNILAAAGHDRIAEFDPILQKLPLTITAFTLAGVSIMGLPPSGGFVAKWLLLQASVQSGQWWWALILLLGGFLAAAYLFRVIGCVFTQAKPSTSLQEISPQMAWPPLVMALLAILLGLLAAPPMTMMELGAPFSLRGSG
ncbi:proton-conducting transporter membrane subunit [Ferrimonas sp. YFM]|uniref:complex I subunit 5 family protein n=1 Tax=Ferrimonas sp. YFM TaxID=3028878 RepID=UPI002572C72C|nr:proton-conducting transporter membrane subunit [Ferrimonas sp. YFM]BDY07039.1 NADH dehydrogenase [Ferrimonas sp. YFM]